MLKNILLIKLGGSVITDKTKPYTAHRQIITRLVREIKKSQKSVIIAHGSGSFGHTSAQKYGGMHGYASKMGIATVAKDAMHIHEIVRDIFLTEGIPVISFSPRSMVASKEGKFQQTMFEPIELAFSQGLIPMVYGDVIWDETWKTTIFSGETILNELAKYFQKKEFVVEKIIEVGDTDGIYDEKGNTISSISQENVSSILASVGKSASVDVTGGMKHKLTSALEIASCGIPTILLNGKISHNLYRALVNKPVKSTHIF